MKNKYADSVVATKTVNYFGDRIQEMIDRQMFYIYGNVANEPEYRPRAVEASTYSESPNDAYVGFRKAKPFRFVQLVSVYDPSPTKDYTKWMIREYLNAGFPRLDILPDLSDLVSEFHDYKAFLPVKHRDINRFTAETLYEFIQNVEVDPRSNREIKREYERMLYRLDEAEIVAEDDDHRIVEVKSHRAAIHFGRHTKWCTSMARSPEHFGKYQKNSLFILLFKRDNKRWQICFETNEIRNELNELVSFDAVKRAEMMNCLIPRAIMSNAETVTLLNYLNLSKSALEFCILNDIKRNRRWTLPNIICSLIKHDLARKFIVYDPRAFLEHDYEYMTHTLSLDDTVYAAKLMFDRGTSLYDISRITFFRNRRSDAFRVLSKDIPAAVAYFDADSHEIMAALQRDASKVIRELQSVGKCKVIETFAPAEKKREYPMWKPALPEDAQIHFLPDDRDTGMVRWLPAGYLRNNTVQEEAGIRAGEIFTFMSTAHKSQGVSRDALYDRSMDDLNATLNFYYPDIQVHRSNLPSFLSVDES